MSFQSRRTRNSFWSWYSHLDLSDKIGFILLCLTGVGLLAMLFSGKGLFQLPMAEAKPLAKKPATLPPGCEAFRLESGPSPLDPAVNLVILGESHDKHESTEKCVAAIAKARKESTYTTFVETVPHGTIMPCSWVPGNYPEIKGVDCIGWDSSDSFQREETTHFARAFKDIMKGIIENPQFSSKFRDLKGLSKKQATEAIKNIITDLAKANRRTLTDLRKPTALSRSSADLKFMRDRNILEEAEKLAWTCYEKGLLAGLTSYKSRLDELIRMTQHTTTSMIHRNKGLVATIRNITETGAQGTSTALVDAHGEVLAVDKPPSKFAFLVAGKCHIAPCTTEKVKGSEAAVTAAIQKGKESVCLLVMP